MKLAAPGIVLQRRDNTAVIFPGIGHFHPDVLMYTFDTGVDIKVERDALEKESCRHNIFERSDLYIRLNGKPLKNDEGVGLSEVRGSDCNVYMPKARLKYDGALLKASEVLEEKLG